MIRSTDNYTRDLFHTGIGLNHFFGFVLYPLAEPCVDFVEYSWKIGIPLALGFRYIYFREVETNIN